MSITQVSSRVAYTNAWMSVREDAVTYADGRPGLYGVVDKPGAAIIIPAADGGVHLVEQYRYPLGRRCWEFPQGSLDADDDGPATAARRELAEETGLTADSVRRIGVVAVAPGFASQRMHVFLATGLHPGSPRRDATELDMRQAFVPRADLDRMIVEGEVEDASTIAAYGLLLTAERRGDAPVHGGGRRARRPGDG